MHMQATIGAKCYVAAKTAYSLTEGIACVRLPNLVLTIGNTLSAIYVYTHMTSTDLDVSTVSYRWLSYTSGS